jgi:hypothetical protein
MMSVKKALIWSALSCLWLMVSGCGSYQGSYNWSPASLFLPGLLQNPIPAVEKTNASLAMVAHPLLAQ